MKSKLGVVLEAVIVQVYSTGGATEGPQDVKFQQLMRISKKAVVLVFAYLALWLATYHFGPARLHAQLVAEASVQGARPRADPSPAGASAPFATGLPRLAVDSVVCPCPFWFRAEGSRVEGPRFRHDFDGWFFWMPWHVYRVYERQT